MDPKPNEIFARRREIETRDLPDGALLVDLNTGKCFRLNGTGARVWSLLEAGLSLRDICNNIAVHYGLSLATVERDVGAVIEHLIRERLVISSPAPEPSAPAGK